MRAEETRFDGDRAFSAKPARSAQGLGLVFPVKAVT